MPQLCLFISCVGNEFGHYRDALRNKLNRPNLTTKIQEDFIAYGNSTMQKLDEYIRNCEAIIHLCGDMTGSMANAASLDYINHIYPDFGKRFPELLPVLEGREDMSYTQWEAWLAAYHKKTLIIATPDKAAPRNSSYQLMPEQAEHQQLHLSRIRSYGYYNEILFSNEDKLIIEVLRSPVTDLLAKLSHSPFRKPINLPYHSIGNLFKGREDAMEALHQKLTRAQAKPTAIIGNTIHGLGGIGKTRLAVEYALQYEDEYTALLFVLPDPTEKLFSNLAALAAPDILNLPEYGLTEEQQRYDAVVNWLNSNPGWLLIFDNADANQYVDALEKFLGKLRGGHVLITSRQREWSGQVSQLPLDVLKPEAATAFLMERTEGKRRKTAEDEQLALLIAEDVGWLALALEQAGAYISTRKLTLTQYRQVWQNNHDQVLEWYDERLMLYPKSVAITWQTTVDQLTPCAKTLLDRLAWLAPDPIPEMLFDTKASTEDSFDYSEALTELDNYSLVDRSGDKPELTIHRLVQDITHRKQEKELAQNRLEESLNWVNDAFTGDPTDIRDWPVLEPLVPHILVLINYAERNGVCKMVVSRLMTYLGAIYVTKAQHKKAEPLMRRALQIDEESLGKNHPDVAIDLNDLAQLLYATNRLVEAEPLMQRALQIDEKSFGEKHPNVAIRLNNLAQLLKVTNRRAEAETLMQRALRIDEKSFGEKHPKVAIRLNNLANLLQATNRLLEAEQLIRRALQIDEESFGESHPQVAIYLNNLATLLMDANRLSEAEPLMRRALQIDEESFGEKHPNVAIDLNNLAQLLQATNRLLEAEPLMRRALQIDEESFGENHPIIAIRLNNLAQLLRATNRLKEAEPLMRRALQIDEESFGESHPDVARDLNNLAQLLKDTNRLKEAEPLMRRSFVIVLISLGYDHPNTQTVFNNYILFLQAMGKNEEEINAILSVLF